jgi:DNA repair protein RecO (recombination protein O)
MQWTDEGILLSMRAHGEGHAVAEILTRAHGRHLGLVRGGSSRRMRPILQPGNSLSLTWTARLESHLGSFTLDLLVERAGRWLHHAAPLHAVSTLGSHLHLLAEREQHIELYDHLVALLNILGDPQIAAAHFVRFEMDLLQDLGFGLDLSSCAATGDTDNLTHVSPRTGRAVGEATAAPYKERLLRLPEFLSSSEITSAPSEEDVADGARLTGYFLERHVYAPRELQLPQARAAFFRALGAGGAETRRRKSG